jgi:DNA modification methylase
MKNEKTYESTAKIKPYHKNAKKHPTKQIEAIAKSIKEYGFRQPIVVDKDNVIIVGHGRFEAAKALGMEEVWIEKTDLTEEQAKEYRLADNKLNESDWDMQLVMQELRELDPARIELTGFSKDLILSRDDKEDNAPELPEIAKTKQGDVYELGRHKIICADSTKTETYQKLMQGTKADMLFTDPPYNVDYSGTGKNTSRGILNDSMVAENFVQFLTDAFIGIATAIKAEAGCYVFHSHKTVVEFTLALKNAGYNIDTQIVWNKPSAGLGMNDYRTKHELMFYCSKSDKKNFYGDRTGTTVWKIPSDERRAMDWFLKTQEKLEAGESTVWTMKRDNTMGYVHPTQKPVELVTTALLKSSKQEDIIIDPFAGSGTTLIAAEKTNRTAYVIELDERFVDVVVQRYVDYTNNKEIKLNGEKIIWEKK